MRRVLSPGCGRRRLWLLWRMCSWRSGRVAVRRIVRVGWRLVRVRVMGVRIGCVLFAGIAVDRACYGVDMVGCDIENRKK
jgi:hypothetical protein